MDRETRVAMNKKQDYFGKIETGDINPNSIQEGSFQLRYINNTVYIIAKKNGIIWYFKGSRVK